MSTRAILLTAICLALGGFGPLRAAEQSETLTLERPQVAGMSGFRAHWDVPLVLDAEAATKVTDDVVKDRGGAAVWADGGGAIAFDALNRSILVRFPDAAEQIAGQIRKGFVVRKAEIVLPFRDEELWPVGNSDYFGPDGYLVRKNWGTDRLYRAVRPEWHAVAWALRKPWTADRRKGPTFNANVHGASYWTKYGAGDPQEDRFPERFGPAKVSYQHPEGRLDVTAALCSPAHGKTLAGRLRTFSDCGFLIQKWETYDHRYFTGVYEWSTATGGRAILIRSPKLIVTFEKGEAELADLPPPLGPDSQRGGRPTAVMPAPEQLRQWAAKMAEKPGWMPPWQWERVRELYAAEKPEKADEPFWFQFVPDFIIKRSRESYREPGKKGIQYKPPRPEVVYALWVDGLIGRQPRGWSGFESAREMAQWYLYHETLPDPAQDAIRRYWTAWLMPDRETVTDVKKRRDFRYVDGPLVHPMVDDPRVGGPEAKWPNPLQGRFDTYFSKAGDWRGNKSFFRSGFCYDMSTQNFNTTACAGALLAGAMIGSERAMADGRYGLETFPLRMYCWSDGSGQEHIDHYYLAVTLAGNKAIADFSQTPYDRLLGQSLLAKDVEELVSAYHPGLRSFIAGASRTSLDFLLGTQDGLQHVMHTLSRSGALRDYGVDKLPGNMATWGHDVPPQQVAQQTLAGAWAPAWVVPMVDDKPLPYEAKHTGWGGARRTCYLGRNYGIASNAVHAGRIQVMAQWRREAKQVAHVQELGTLDLRCGVNNTLWVNDGQGRITPFGSVSALQAKNKLLAVTSPVNISADNVTSIQSSIGLFNFQEPAPTWEVYVDGQKVERLPFRCKQGQRITVRDGVTYLGVIPLPATDLGRDAEVVLEEGTPQKAAFYQSNIKAAMVINSYNYRSDKPLASVAKTLGTAVGKAYGGFAVELADQDDYRDFAAFQNHLAGTKLDVRFDDKTSTASVKYVSGPDILEAASVTFVADEADPSREKGDASLVRCLVNDKDPNLPAGLQRDTPYCQQGFARVEKNGATLTAEADRRVFLLTEPKAGVFCGWNPLPDLTTYKLTVPGGLTVTADGRVGLTRVIVRPATNTVEIDSAFKPGQERAPGAATAMLILGVREPPRVTLGGAPIANLETVRVKGQTAYRVPLR